MEKGSQRDTPTKTIANSIGLWVPCESKNCFLDSAVGVNQILTLVERLNVSDVFLQVFRGGRAWFPTSEFELGTSSSHLPQLLSALTEHNVRAHAWINVCNAGENTSPAFIERLGGEAALLQNGFEADSRIPMPGFEIDTAGLWLEPSNPLLVETLRSVGVALANLPFSGVHLDFIRYPYVLPMKPASWIDCGIEFGYSKQARERFEQTYKLKDPFTASTFGGLIPNSERLGQLFDSWRRNCIDDLVKCFRDSMAPGTKLSVAALAWSDRAYLNAFQDWRSWLSNNLVDTLCLMTYSADTQLLSQQLRQAQAFANSEQPLFAGIGLYKLQNLEELRQQLSAIRSLGASPCYFCAQRLLDPPFDSFSSSA